MHKFGSHRNRARGIVCAVVSIAWVASAACGGGETEPATPQTPTSSPEAASQSPTPATTPVVASTAALTDEAVEFQGFAQSIDAAVKNRDVGFFMGHLELSPVTCTEADVEGQIGGPVCDFAGQTFEGIPLGRYGSEGSVVPPDAAEAQFSRLFTSIDGAEDHFGNGAPRLHALALGPEQGGYWRPHLAAITTSIAQPVSTRQAALPARFILITYWSKDSGEWRITNFTIAAQADELLTPKPGDDYFTNYVLYE